MRRLLLTLPLLLIAGCDNAGESSAGAGTESDAIETRTYTTRGRVATVPSPASPLTEFAVHHEEIPEFVGRNGELGMNEMVMPFPLGDGISVDNLTPGQPIELVFNVDWVTSDGTPAYYVTQITELPAETELNLNNE